ncbi:hypothetical protein ABE509_09285 [[Pseudomonas] hibiscicola]|uniref:hypothetical protein n=1 Tax=Stenotrophomonas hibiscicola TaxID=86189 RepID=UPI0032087487
MSNDNKTLADVQPGGRVRLGDQPPFVFVRFVNGVRMAEGVTIEKERNLTDAMQVAAKVASKGPNGEVPVLVHVATLSAQPSPGGQGDAPLRVFSAGRWTYDGTGQSFSHEDMDAAAFVVYRDAALSSRQPVGEPVSDECEGCKGGIRYDAQGCSCMTCGKRPKWYMAGRRIRVTERRKPWKHLGAPVPFEAECTWQMGDSIDYRLDGETTSRRLNNFHQHWEKVEVIR